MNAIANVAIHASQFPENIRRDLLASLRTRRVNHKFHYDSVKQTQKWLALHEAHSPARYDKHCLATYDRAFIEAASQIKSKQVHVIGLGCGGGQKDMQLMKLLRAQGRKIFYTPCDVSTAMTLVARRAALKILPAENCFPLVCDLVTAKDLPAVFGQGSSPHVARLVTFFGMIPNFEPQIILPKLASMVLQNDFLLFSANLAPGRDYTAGIKNVLPQYDNALTRDWLTTFLLDLGIERRDGALRFAIEAGGLGLKRIVARFYFKRSRQIQLDGKVFKFFHGESIRLFFSYRYTPELVQKVLTMCDLKVCEQWVTPSEEEGVFLCRRK